MLLWILLAGIASLLGALRGDAATVLAELKVLDLGGNRVDAKTSPVFGELLSRATSLHELFLDDMGSLDLDAIAFGGI